MQTFLLSIWPFLNLILIMGVGRMLIRLITGSIKNTFYKYGVLLCLVLVVVFCSRALKPSQEYKFIYQQPQTTLPIIQEAYHDGMVLTSPTLSIKSHVAVWPLKLPDTGQPVASESGQQPDALSVSLSFLATSRMPGVQWIPENTEVHIFPNRLLVYEASGYIVWSIVGFPVYNEPKRYIGRMKI